jgi:hypothetical protein
MDSLDGLDDPLKMIIYNMRILAYMQGMNGATIKSMEGPYVQCLKMLHNNDQHDQHDQHNQHDQHDKPKPFKLCSQADQAYFDVDQFGSIVGWFGLDGSKTVLLRLHLDACRVKVNRQQTMMCVYNQEAYVFKLSDLVSSLSTNNKLVYQTVQFGVDDRIGSKMCQLVQPGFLVFEPRKHNGSTIVYDLQQNRKVAEFSNAKLRVRYAYHADSQTLCFYLVFKSNLLGPEVWALRPGGLRRLFFIHFDKRDPWYADLLTVPTGFQLRYDYDELLHFDAATMMDTCEDWHGSVQ